MISDTLSDAAHEIRRYLDDMPDVYGATIRPEIDKVLGVMDALRIKLDAPPPLLKSVPPPVNSRVRFTQDVENYPHVFVKVGATGTFLRVDDDGSFWVLLDAFEPGIDEWDNEVMIWDYSEQGPQFHPAAYIEQIEESGILGGDALAAAGVAYGDWLNSEKLPEASADELLAGDDLTEDQREWLSGFYKHWERLENRAAGRTVERANDAPPQAVQAADRLIDEASATRGSWTIETTYRLPVYRQRKYEAKSLDDAMAAALDDDDWVDAKQDYENSGPHEITGIWEGEAYNSPEVPFPRDPEPLVAIFKLMDGTEWGTDMVDAIAQIMRNAGYPIRDVSTGLSPADR
jgi:hypothetical protein